MKQIKHYKIAEKLGSGGMGEVYKAFDSVLERDVAIKIMHRHLLDNEKSDQRFMQEARAAAKLVHPNIVTIYEVGKTKHGRHIVMEYVRGRPLTQLFNAKDALKPERAIKLAIQILNGLFCAHSLGILHRDIKPDNILVTDNDIAKILDFGVAKMTAKKGLTVAGDILGTVEYMAPEQMLGDVIDHRCDIYPTGVVLYQMLTNRLPFTGETPVALLYKQLNEDPIPPSYYNREVGQELDQTVLKAITKSTEERWETAEAFSKALEAILRSGTYPSISLQTDALDDLTDLDVEIEAQAQHGDLNTLRSVFIGREKEFKRLVNMFSQASQGEGKTVILMGETGVGKSTIANRLRNYAEQNKASVLYGACLYQEGMDAYLPYIDALRGFFSKESHNLPEEERIKLKSMVREKVPLLMEFTERFTTSFGPRPSTIANSSDSENDGLFDGIYQLISLIATMRPVILIVDDLQWADEASLRLFHYLSRQVADNRVLLLGISRSDRYDLQKNGKPTAVVDVLARIRREGACEQISLYRLSRESCDVLIDKTLASTLFTEEFYERVYEETKGNPLFVLETLKLLRETGAIFFKDGAWYNKQDSLQLTVPNRVEDVFMRRLNALSEDERELLQVAAVHGYKFDASLLSQVMEVTKIKLLKNLQRVERELQILASTDQGFQFEHPMLRDLLYNEIPEVLRREYHLMIAAEMESIHKGNYGALVGEVAQHLRRGGEHDKAAPLLYEAAMRSFKLAAYREAILLFEDFMHSAEHGGEQRLEFVSYPDLYLKMGRSYEENGQWKESIEAYTKLLEISEKVEDPQGQIDALERMGRLQAKHGDGDMALRTYKRCLHIVKRHKITSVLSRLYNSLGIIHFQRGDYDQALQYFEQSIQEASSESEEFHKANALTNLGIIANIRANYKAALNYNEKALNIFERIGDRKNQARVHHNIGMTYSDLGDWAKSIDAFKRCLELTDQVEDKQLRALIYLNMGKVYVRQQKFPQAKKYTEKALKMFKRMGDNLSVAEAYHVFGLIHAARGNLSEAELLLKESIHINEQKGYLEGLAESCVSYGNICGEQGNFELAIEHYKKALEAYKKLNLDVKVTEISKILDEHAQNSEDGIKVLDDGIQQPEEAQRLGLHQDQKAQ